MDFWPKHKDDTPYCQCRVCYWANQEDDMEGNSMYEPTFLYSQGDAPSRIFTPAHPKPLAKPLEVRIAEDITSLTAGFGGYETEKEPHKEGIELPEKEYDLTAYKDALEFAQKSCMHDRVQPDNLFDPTRMLCIDCHRDMSYQEFLVDRMNKQERFRQRFRRK